MAHGTFKVLETIDDVRCQRGRPLLGPRQGGRS